MAGISDPKRKKLQRDVGIWTWRCFGIACLASLAYVLAYGPLGYLTKRGLLTQRSLETLYKPLNLIAVTPARRLLGRYNELWVPIENSRCGGILKTGQRNLNQLQSFPVGTNATLNTIGVE